MFLTFYCAISWQVELRIVFTSAKRSWSMPSNIYKVACKITKRICGRAVLCLVYSTLLCSRLSCWEKGPLCNKKEPSYILHIKVSIFVLWNLLFHQLPAGCNDVAKDTYLPQVFNIIKTANKKARKENSTNRSSVAFLYTQQPDQLQTNGVVAFQVQIW